MMDDDIQNAALHGPRFINLLHKSKCNYVKKSFEPRKHEDTEENQLKILCLCASVVSLLGFRKKSILENIPAFPFLHELVEKAEHDLMPLFCYFFGSRGIHHVFQ